MVMIILYAQILRVIQHRANAKSKRSDKQSIALAGIREPTSTDGSNDKPSNGSQPNVKQRSADVDYAGDSGDSGDSGLVVESEPERTNLIHIASADYQATTAADHSSNQCINNNTHCATPASNENATKTINKNANAPGDVTQSSGKATIGGKTNKRNIGVGFNDNNNDDKGSFLKNMKSKLSNRRRSFRGRTDKVADGKERRAIKTLLVVLGQYSLLSLILDYALFSYNVHYMYIYNMSYII